MRLKSKITLRECLAFSNSLSIPKKDRSKQLALITIKVSIPTMKISYMLQTHSRKAMVANVRLSNIRAKLL